VKTYKSDIYSVNDKGARVFVETVETLDLPEAIARLTKEAKEHNTVEDVVKTADPKYVAIYMPTVFAAPISGIK